MASKVVSTKLTEEEYGKLVGICSTSGYTVSKLLKRAILAKMNESAQIEKPQQAPAKVLQSRETPMVEVPQENKKRVSETKNQEERFLYY